MILRFDENIYSEKAIIAAIRDFLPIADIGVVKDSGFYICTITRSKFDMQKTAHEFSNYILDLSVMGETTK